MTGDLASYLVTIEWDKKYVVVGGGGLWVEGLVGRGLWVMDRGGYEG